MTFFVCSILPTPFFCTCHHLLSLSKIVQLFLQNTNKIINTGHIHHTFLPMALAHSHPTKKKKKDKYKSPTTTTTKTTLPDQSKMTPGHIYSVANCSFTMSCIRWVDIMEHAMCQLKMNLQQIPGLMRYGAWVVIVNFPAVIFFK